MLLMENYSKRNLKLKLNVQNNVINLLEKCSVNVYMGTSAIIYRQAMITN